MLSIVFISQNLHFAVELFAALVTFAVFWLYFDAWLARKKVQQIPLWLGFFLLSFSFLVNATIIDRSILVSPVLGKFSEALAVIVRLLGYGLIIFNQIRDPLQKVPHTEGLKLESKSALLGFVPVSISSQLFAPLGSFACSLLYYRRSTAGLERHLKTLAIAFAILGVSETFSLSVFLRNSDNPFIYSLSASFGLLWYLQIIALLIAMAVMGRWVWQYLVTRLQSQLFMIFTSAILAIFLLTTVSFTFLLLRNVENESLDNLETATKVLDYALKSRKEETLSSSESLATNPDIVKAVFVKDHKALNNQVQKLLETKAKSSILVTDESGMVLSRAEEPDRWGDSLSDDPLTQRALVGLLGSSISAKEGIIAPLIYIKAASPVRDGNKNIIGSITVGVLIDNGFVDGIKATTGLDSAVYGGNVRAATTLTAPDGKSRWVGIKEENPEIKNQVLKNGSTFKGSVAVLNQPFIGAYSPLKDVNNEIVGMIFIGKPQSSILLAAGKSIELTFLVAAILISLSIVPSFLISRYLSRQLS